MNVEHPSDGFFTNNEFGLFKEADFNELDEAFASVDAEHAASPVSQLRSQLYRQREDFIAQLDVYSHGMHRSGLEGNIILVDKKLKFFEWFEGDFARETGPMDQRLAEAERLLDGRVSLCSEFERVRFEEFATQLKKAFRAEFDVAEIKKAA